MKYTSSGGVRPFELFSYFWHLREVLLERSLQLTSGRLLCLALTAKFFAQFVGILVKRLGYWAAVRLSLKAEIVGHGGFSPSGYSIGLGR